MKQPSSFLALLGVFVAGFIAGILFSAWKLDRNPMPHPSATRHEQEPDHAADSRARIEALERMVASNPDNAQAMAQLGNDYFDAGNHQKAVEAYQKSLAIDPRNPDVLTDMGISYRKLGKPEQSVAAFRKAVEVDSSHPLAMFNLGIVLRDDLKDRPAALKAWEQFLDKAGDSPHAVMVRPWVKQLRDELAKAPIDR